MQRWFQTAAPRLLVALSAVLALGAAVWALDLLAEAMVEANNNNLVTLLL